MYKPAVPLRNKVQNLINVSSIERVMVMPIFLLAMVIYYTCIHFAVVLTNDSYWNVEYVSSYLWVDALFLAITSAILLCRRYIMTNQCIARFFPYAVAPLYICMMMYYGVHVGLLTFATGAVIASNPMFAFILFDRGLVYFILLCGGLTYVLLTMLVLLKVLPNAPALNLVAIYGQNAMLYYMALMIVTALPHIITMMYMNHVLFVSWRKREKLTKQLSLTDSLTQVRNRRGIALYLREALNDHKKQKLSLILLDVDHFKQINDQYGHPTGDRVLAVLGRSLIQVFGHKDAIGRYGGEEFLVVLKNQSLEEAAVLAETCRQRIEKLLIRDAKDQNLVAVQASFGVYEVKLGDSMDRILYQLDLLLYTAKAEGRNQVRRDGEQINDVIHDKRAFSSTSNPQVKILAD